MSVSSIHNSASYDASLTIKAPQNPADKAIAEKMESQISGYRQGTKNAQTGQDLVRTSEQALASISEQLSRMKEIGIAASSDMIYSASDRKNMQMEIEQLKEGITDIARGTQFNTKNLLDGSMADLHLATNPKGDGVKLYTTDATLENLGIADFDVTGDFDLSSIDNAMKIIQDARSNLGAADSALSHSINASNIASENLTGAESALDDVDIEEYVSEMQKDKIMTQYQYFAQNAQADQEAKRVNTLVSRMFEA